MSRQNIQRIPSPRAPLDPYMEFFLISWFLVIDEMLKYLVAEYFVFGRSALFTDEFIDDLLVEIFSRSYFYPFIMHSLQ